MGPGNTIRLRYFETVSEDGKVRAGYSALKGMVFVCLVLGFEAQPLPPSMVTPMRHDAMLRDLGWSFTPEVGS